MRTTFLGLLLAAATSLPAGAGSPDCRTLGIEGLCPSPLDLSVDVGGSLHGWEIDSETRIDQPAIADDSTLSEVISHEDPGATDESVDFDPFALQYGARASGGLSYRRAGFVIEPAVAFWWNDVGGEKEEGAGDLDRIEELVVSILPVRWETRAETEIELEQSFDVAAGLAVSIPPPFSWIPRPIVWFPFAGVSFSEWEVELRQRQALVSIGPPPLAPGFAEEEYHQTSLLLGFDLDLPLPGLRGPLTHALTFGFKWIESDEDHELAGPTPISAFDPGLVGRTTHEFDVEGWRVELRYRVTWNDVSGFFRRQVFGRL